MTDKEIIIELETLIEMVNDNIDNVNQNGIAKFLRRLADKIEKESELIQSWIKFCNRLCEEIWKSLIN